LAVERTALEKAADSQRLLTWNVVFAALNEMISGGFMHR